MSKKVKWGIVFGLIFGALDIIPMFFMDFTSPIHAITGAFVNRFAIGLLIPTTDFGIPSWLKGLFIGILLSLPDAMITGAAVPIMTTGIVGGLIIGILSDKIKTYG